MADNKKARRMEKKANKGQTALKVEKVDNELEADGGGVAVQEQTANSGEPAIDASVSIEQPSPAVDAKADKKAAMKADRAKKSVVVTGTSTWRDGFTIGKVGEWEKWAKKFVADVRADPKIVCSIADDAVLADMCCTAWREGGKNFREKTLLSMIPTFTV